MSRSLKWLFFVYTVIFIATGASMVLVFNGDESSAEWVKLLARNFSVVFTWHLACWLLTGMIANYYWDLFNVGKGASDMQIERIVLPLLVAPFVFLPTYNLWQSSGSQSYLLFDVISFQSGFFWHALFTKARPLEASGTSAQNVRATPAAAPTAMGSISSQGMGR